MEIRHDILVSDTITVSRIGHLTLTSRWQGNVHMHDDVWELIVPLGGRLLQTTSENMKELAEHLFYLIPPHTNHAFVNADNRPASMLYIYFTFTFAPMIEKVENLQTYIDRIPEMAVFHGELLRAIGDAGTIDEEQMNRSRGYILQIMARFVQYLYMYADADMKSVAHQNVIISNVKTYIESHISETVNVAALADYFYLSPSYLGALFQKNTHMSIKQYHEQLRMKKALEMLRTSYKNGNISQISETLGYSTVQYFTRRFRQYYSVTPSRKTENRQKVQ